MPKATEVKATVNEIPSQECIECHKTISAPWARTKNGWICSSKCQTEHDTKAYTLPILDVLAGNTANRLGDIA